MTQDASVATVTPGQTKRRRGETCRKHGCEIRRSIECAESTGNAKLYEAIGQYQLTRETVGIGLDVQRLCVLWTDVILRTKKRASLPLLQ